MQDLLLEQGLELLVYGMGTVFVFLILLVYAVNLMSWIIATYFPEPEPQVAPHPKPNIAQHPVDETTLAVIKAAIRQHRDKLQG
ncbi:OadG family protein [Cellvibrio japonicus]|uniref:Probable oxaloacetate decarboxylase gamma chain n=1 Tax=Cellvibrio japonicus (strain Ueda107) TaxID=498211 RepID=B3PBI9_CELJU|nr:OadG family protein [Cellvibrio japonicus]ACE83083.1 oxaloacetate decarboxylase gamma chain [Cellvibrio japonicus Ueda107]QEI13103.1 oxaloacetate decarboxylase [Cellvibrio japonicus]QEI16677.1 oxaloacetate decarboxylase [Cellvibrio japonicus]QEI20255.1 oxaloacetate decarboxylase [Cellvibrio japonicus]